MTTQLLIDSSFLLNSIIPEARGIGRRFEFLTLHRERRLIPDVVLTETSYLLKAKISQRAAMNFLDSLDAPTIQLEAITKSDLKRVRQIMVRYESANLDFVDCCIMVLSERLNITQVCTFDRRDFSIFRPEHCEYLELLP